ncbi:cytoplasm protein [Dioszegia hungarica]|uniref:Cytoplasm protein n=1 Tax=Dioszegia hungarica TaxID=4972 RepID=A0AA38LT09_9TREE|nr:cytoplasm protein [Dioszegia hungarica]KAI9633164.1 cytoplasm protein [Dioszegia hungarica]
MDSNPDTAGNPQDLEDQFDGETADNAQEIEMHFAEKTAEYLNAYEKLLGAVPPRQVKLSPIDAELLDSFLDFFPEYKLDAALALLDEDEMKSMSGKERWRSFTMPYESRVEDFNFGTLVRRNAIADEPYGQDNCILVTRVQFLAIEIARNRAGLNDKVYNAAQAAMAVSS